MDFKEVSCIFISSLLFSLCAVPLLCRWAFNRGVLDNPGQRRVHKVAVPRLGGIAIFLGFLFAVLIYMDMPREVRGILIGALFLFFTGLLDDFFELPPKMKFIGQIIGCSMAITISRLYISNLGDVFGFGEIVLPLWLAIPFTIFAVVGVTNAVNLIDGLDGLAGGISAIALSAFLLLGYLSGMFAVVCLAAALLGSVLGFLKYNMFPARVFMGDSGSLVVGFILAFLAIFLTQSTGAQVSPVVPLNILGLPIIDTISVMVGRVLRNRSPFAPDQTHVHHKFLHIGLDHKIAVVAIYIISILWTVLTFVLKDKSSPFLFCMFIIFSIIIYLVLGIHGQKVKILNKVGHENGIS